MEDSVCTPCRPRRLCASQLLAATASVFTLSACGPVDAPASNRASVRSAPAPLAAQQEAHLTRSVPAMFGASVAITADFAFVSDPMGHESDGSVTVFERNGTAWSQGQTLLASDGENDDYFGMAIAAEGTTAIIGTFKDDPDPGAAYVFELSGQSWHETAKLIASDGESNDGFGASVALSGDTAAVTALSMYGESSAVYVFERPPGGDFTQQTKLGSGGQMDGFGLDLDIDGDTIAVGAPWAGGGVGAVYMYERSGSTWDEEVIYLSSTSQTFFGTSVAIEGDTLLASAPYEYNGSVAGEVHVFTKGPGGWSHTTTLQPADSETGDCFGSSVALVDGAALIGASHNFGGTASGPGAAYWFVRRQAGWQEADKLVASDAGDGDLFGETVAAETHRAIVGAGPDLFWGAGEVGNQAAYVFSVVREEGDPCSSDSQCESAACSSGYCSAGTGGTGGSGGTGGTGGTGATGGSGGTSGAAGAGGAARAAGASTGGTGAQSGTGGSAGLGGTAGGAGTGGATAGSGGTGGGSSPSATDEIESSRFYACSTGRAPTGGSPSFAAWLLGLLLLRRTRRA